MEVRFSDLIQAAGDAGFTVLPKGWYDLVVDAAEPGQIQGGDNQGQPRIKVKFRVISGPFAAQGATVTNNFNLIQGNANQLAFFFEHMAALGLPKEWFAQLPPASALQIAAQALLGRQCRAHINDERMYNGRKQNDVTDIQPPTGGVVVPSQPSFGQPSPYGPAPVAPPMMQPEQQWQQPQPPQMAPPMAPQPPAAAPPMPFQPPAYPPAGPTAAPQQPAAPPAYPPAQPVQPAYAPPQQAPQAPQPAPAMPFQPQQPAMPGQPPAYGNPYPPQQQPPPQQPPAYAPPQQPAAPPQAPPPPPQQGGLPF